MLNKSVLIIDDEPDIRALLAALLLGFGMQSKAAASVNEALAVLQENHFDYIFIDVNLPDGLGTGIIPKIKNQGQHPRIIVMSAIYSEEYLQLDKNSTVIKFMQKPFTKADIRAILA